jgi:predicted nucleic-acid-binding protein
MYQFKKVQNNILTTLFHNQEKHADFLEERKYQTTDEDVRMSSMFVIGQNMLVRVLLLKKGQKVTSERIRLCLNAGVNELVTFVRQFLNVVFKVVDDGFLRLSDIEHPTDEEFEIIRGKLYVDFTPTDAVNGLCCVSIGLEVTGLNACS